MADDDKCECGARRSERCVDCGGDIHAPENDCPNQHHEFVEERA